MRPKGLDGIEGSKKDVQRSLRCIMGFTEASQEFLEAGNPESVIKNLCAILPHIGVALRDAGGWAALQSVIDGTYKDPKDD